MIIMHFTPTRIPDALLVEADIYGDNRRKLWIPTGFIHGFLVSSEVVEIQCKCIDFYAPDFEMTIRLDDADLAIDWPFVDQPLFLAKDEQAASFRNAECFD